MNFKSNNLFLVHSNYVCMVNLLCLKRIGCYYIDWREVMSIRPTHQS